MSQNLNLAAIGNGTIAALIDKNGRINWCCWPRIDGDPIFSALLGGEEPEAGFFDVLLDGQVAATRTYRHNTAIIETVLENADGAKLRIVDYAPRFKLYDRMYRPAMLVRRLEPISGTCRVTIRLRPHFNWGEQRPKPVRGSNHMRFSGEDFTLRATTDLPIVYVMEERPFVLSQAATFVLGPDEPFASSVADTTHSFESRTQDYWSEWVRYLSVPFEWQDAVIRAAISLKLCAFEETGGIVAALTTSIPEAPNTVRNWDYRHSWLRDSYFTVRALNQLGATRTMEDYIRYLTTIIASEPSGRLSPVYSIVPGTHLEERFAPALPGFRGMGPVRVGNQAAEQVQNDGYGHVVLAAAQMFFDERLPKRGDKALFNLLEGVGARAAEFAFEPDAGLWELRGRRRVHTFSAVMGWAACDRLARIARVLDLPDRVTFWADHANDIRQRVLAFAWSEEKGSFVDADVDGQLDASLLLLAELGFVRPDDPRYIATVECIGRDLKRNGYLMRYANEDDFGLPESSFTICSFWYACALDLIGRREEAREMFTSLLARRNEAGLLSEDIDNQTLDLWGNIPQTYSMVGLIDTAMRLSKTWEEAFWRGS
ncbi:glycoside hydrolase family 15 protein [Ancylobacter pratisalsi]|uniref:Glycoside hydrolase family 15 protein n=1 Tax=Ancylobacter pratisalsi TaxID=1745854 RepID=A0A6P1YIQ1_9HYPH|nr:glycoside hydrolase family 15 protein [Ancylobacter pratisalsi]QIB32586.1 glycoside hydrolase family 15 protein [Ancylobacter pratisalsi]